MMTSVGCQMVLLSTVDFFVAAAAATVDDAHEGAAVDVVLVATQLVVLAIGMQATLSRSSTTS